MSCSIVYILLSRPYARFVLCCYVGEDDRLRVVTATSLAPKSNWQTAGTGSYA